MIYNFFFLIRIYYSNTFYIKIDFLLVPEYILKTKLINNWCNYYFLNKHSKNYLC